MHPILESRRRLLAYLAAWVPVAGLLAYVLGANRALAGTEAAAIAAPLCLLYAFMLLPVWYSCRVLPLDRGARAVAVQVAAAVIASGIWVVAARGWARALAHAARFAGLEARLAPELPLIAAAGILLYLLAVTVDYLLLAVGRSREAEVRLVEARLFARVAELRALKAQINPHFLFNSLNSVSALTASDPARARQMCILLGDFLRRTLRLAERAAIPLEEELGLVRAFLAVEKVRFGDRIEMREMIAGGGAAAQVPPLLLQPLVENAVVHGIAPLVEGGWIELRVVRRDGHLLITVENSYDGEAPAARREGVGLENVRGRLAACYGESARLEAGPVAAGAEGEPEPRYRAVITLPLEVPA